MLDLFFSQIIELIEASMNVHPWIVHVIHLSLAILLFFLMNWIGRNSISEGYMQLSVIYQDNTAPAFNFVFKVVGPVVYLVLCAVIFQSIGLLSLVYKCYFIVIYYWAFRLLWNIIFNRWILTDWIQLVIYWCSSIGLALWIYSNIEKVEKILPDGKGLIDQMWILIIAFLYTMFNKMRFGDYRTIKRKDRYVVSRYKKFKEKYNDIIHPFFNHPCYDALTYAIMIYEDFNRPYMIRKIEDLRFILTRKQHTLGIMQVSTKEYINDITSIRLAMKKIAQDSDSYRTQHPNLPDVGDDRMNRSVYVNGIVDYIARQYNGGNPIYSGEISDIFEYLMSSFYSNQYPENIAVLSAHGFN